MRAKTKRALKTALWLVVSIPVVAFIIFFIEFKRSTNYQDMRSGLVERRDTCWGFRIHTEQATTPVSEMYDKYVGTPPANREWRIGGGYTTYNVFGQPLGDYCCRGWISIEITEALHSWLEQGYYHDGGGRISHGLTDDAKGVLLTRTLETSIQMEQLRNQAPPGTPFYCNPYLNKAYEATRWIDHQIGVADLPTVEDALYVQFWDANWKPRIAKMEATAKRPSAGDQNTEVSN